MTPTLYIGLPSAAQLSYQGRLHLPIIQTVSSVFNIPHSQIIGPRRLQNIVDARAVAIHLVRKHTKMSLKQIGRAFGGRNHATVLNALHVFQDMYDTDKVFRRMADEAEKKISENY